MERLLDKAGRAQEVERGAEAIEETAAVAAPLPPRAGGAFGYWGAWLKEQPLSIICEI